MKIFVPEISNPAKVARIRSYGGRPGAGRPDVRRGARRQPRVGPRPRRRRGARLRRPRDGHGRRLARARAAGAGTRRTHGDRRHRRRRSARRHRGRLRRRRPRASGPSPTARPTLTRALAAGHPVDAPTGSVAVDSLAPRQVGEHTFAVLDALDVEATLVSDDEIVAAQRTLWDRLRVAAEPGGATAFAALLAGRLELGPRPGGRRWSAAPTPPPSSSDRWSQLSYRCSGRPTRRAPPGP